MNEIVTLYQEIDFLLTAQRFNIQFSYVSQRGLPFIREFVLRLIHIAPMTKHQVGIYLGLSSLEIEEAISDLVQRDELTLSDDGRLKLTEKAGGYFYDLGEVPQLSAIMESGANLSFDLASFSSLEEEGSSIGWKAGIPLQVDQAKQSNSEQLVKKEFQQQFNHILDKGLLKKSVGQSDKERPSVYTVSSVKKLRQLPLRLKTEFRVTPDGERIELEDYEKINSSEVVHQLITDQLSILARPNNMIAITSTMLQVGDEDTLKVFDKASSQISPNYLLDLNRLEEHEQKCRETFLGPIYTKSNWQKLQRVLAPVLTGRIKSRKNNGGSRFTWLAPSDPFWGKSEYFLSAFSDFTNKAETKKVRLYKPTLYVPVSGNDDVRLARQWSHELGDYSKYTKGIVEGFMDGNVEILHLEQEFIVVIYHFSLPEKLPATMPLGFISTDNNFVSKLGKLFLEYVDGMSSFDKPNDCGSIKHF